jgi:hypothetical protein
LTRWATSIAADPAGAVAGNCGDAASFSIMRAVHWAIAAASARR